MSSKMVGVSPEVHKKLTLLFTWASKRNGGTHQTYGSIVDTLLRERADADPEFADILRG